jgi:hypothetical protein
MPLLDTLFLGDNPAYSPGDWNRLALADLVMGTQGGKVGKGALGNPSLDLTYNPDDAPWRKKEAADQSRLAAEGAELYGGTPGKQFLGLPELPARAVGNDPGAIGTAYAAPQNPDQLYQQQQASMAKPMGGQGIAAGSVDTLAQPSPQAPQQALQPQSQQAAPMGRPSPAPAAAPQGGLLSDIFGGIGNALGIGPSSAAPSAPMGGIPNAQGPQRTPGLWERLSALGHGYNSGGLIGGIGDAIGGENRAAETQNLTMQALIAKGMDPMQARAVAQNPELAKTVIPTLFAPDFTTVGTDQFGNPIHGFVNRANETVTLPGQAPGAPLNGLQDMTHFTQLLNSGVTGKELLSKLDPATAGQVQALIEGREPVGNVARATGRWQMLLALAHRVDPKFDATTYAMRQDLRKNLEGYGKGGQEATAANTAIEHLHELSQLGENLSNVGGAWILNKPANEIQGAYRWLTGDNRPNSFNALRDLAVSEVDKFYKATKGGETERRALSDQISATSTPQQLRSVIATMATAMGGKVQELERRWQNGMGPSVAPLGVLSDESKAKINDIQRRAGLIPQFGRPAQLPQGVTPEIAISQAQQAIQAGADPAKVKERLQQLGIAVQ